MPYETFRGPLDGLTLFPRGIVAETFLLSISAIFGLIHYFPILKVKWWYSLISHSNQVAISIHISIFAVYVSIGGILLPAMYISIEKCPGVSVQKCPVFQLAVGYCCYRKLCTVVTENWHLPYTLQLIGIEIEVGSVFRRWVAAVYSAVKRLYSR